MSVFQFLFSLVIVIGCCPWLAAAELVARDLTSSTMAVLIEVNRPIQLIDNPLGRDVWDLIRQTNGVQKALRHFECGVLAGRMRAHGFHNRAGAFAGDDGGELSFVGEVNRVQAEDRAHAPHRVAHWQQRFLDSHSHAGALRELVQDCRQSATRCVAQAAQVGTRGEHRLHQAVQGLRVALDPGIQRQVTAGVEDGDAVVAELANAFEDILSARAVKVPETYAVGCTIKWK